MNDNKSASNLLAKIENGFFKGVDLAAATMMEGDERRAFRLSQVERLLTEMHGYAPLGSWLSDVFWTADEGRKLYSKSSPLLSLEEQQKLTDEERAQLQLILEIAGLCHDLYLHFTFNLQEAYGVKNDWWISNKQLVGWLYTTEYEKIAMHTAYMMKKFAIGVYEGLHYQPAQDEIAELYSSEYKELIRQPDSTKIPAHAYVKIILDALLEIERHWQRGRRLKLRPDLIKLHDEIYGVVPRRFDKDVLAAAQALYDYMDSELQGRLVLKEYNFNANSWSEQPESVRRITAEVMHQFTNKVREVRAKYLAEGWIADDSLSFDYLMAHAQLCGHGWWREEDEAL